MAERIYKKDGNRISKKRNILWRDYQAMCKLYEGKSTVLERERLATFFPNQKLLVDKFEIQGVTFLQIIIEIEKTKGLISDYNTLLPQIKNNVVLEISDDPNFRIEEISKPDWKLYESTKAELLDFEKFKAAMEMKSPTTDGTVEGMEVEIA